MESPQFVPVEDEVGLNPQLALQRRIDYMDARVFGPNAALRMGGCVISLEDLTLPETGEA